jgi:ankyrin repeat protein
VLLAAGATMDPARQFDYLTASCTKLDDAAAAKVVKLLLPHCSHSCDAVSRNSGRTPLMHAVIRGKLLVAQTLQAAGASVRCYGKDGSLMHYAASSGSVAVVKWLQSLGLNARARNTAGALPLHYACCKHAGMVQYLLSLPGAAGDVHARSAVLQTPLYWAATHKADSVVQLLLQQGADVNHTDVFSVTPLMLAKTAPAVKLLLAAGADAAAVRREGSTVLHLHAQYGAAAGAVCLAIKAGADPTAVDVNGSTAAHIAGIKGHFALEALLSRAADDHRKKQIASSSSSSSSCISSSSGISSSSNGGNSSSDFYTRCNLCCRCYHSTH